MAVRATLAPPVSAPPTAAVVNRLLHETARHYLWIDQPGRLQPAACEIRIRRRLWRIPAKIRRHAIRRLPEIH